jgi:hypothetical protein
VFGNFVYAGIKAGLFVDITGIAHREFHIRPAFSKLLLFVLPSDLGKYFQRPGMPTAECAPTSVEQLRLAAPGGDGTLPPPLVEWDNNRLRGREDLCCGALVHTFALD